MSRRKQRLDAKVSAQIRALNAIGVRSGLSRVDFVRDMAHRCGVGERTIWRWLLPTDLFGDSIPVNTAINLAKLAIQYGSPLPRTVTKKVWLASCEPALVRYEKMVGVKISRSKFYNAIVDGRDG